MTASSIPFSGATRRTTTGVQAFPIWAILLTLVVGGALAFGAMTNDKMLGMGIAVIGLVFASLLVLYKPHLGVLIILSTMLMSYPAALKGVGPLTINNLLGVSLLLILSFQLYRSHDYWFLREPEIRLLIIIALTLVAMQYVNKLVWPDIKYLLPKVQKSGVVEYYGEVDVSGRWIFELLSRIAFTIFFINWIRTPQQLKWILFVIAVCIVAVVPTLGPDMVKGTAEYRITSKVAGWAENINRFAFMMNVGIALFVYLASVAKSVPARIMWLLFAAGCAPLVLMTASRSGFLGLCLIGLLMLWGDQVPRRVKIITAVSTMTLGLLFFFFVLSDQHRERLMNLNPFAEPAAVHTEGDRSSQVRVATLGEAFSIIREHPLTGVGLGNFRWVNAYLNGSYKPPHNSYVWSAAEGGIFTTILYLTLFGFLFSRIQKLRSKYKSHPQVRGLPDWLHLYLLLFFFFSMFADVWLEVHIYFMVSIAIVLERFALDEELRGRGLPGVVLGTPGARRAAVRQLYKPRPEPEPA